MVDLASELAALATGGLGTDWARSCQPPFLQPLLRRSPFPFLPRPCSPVQGLPSSLSPLPHSPHPLTSLSCQDSTLTATRHKKTQMPRESHRCIPWPSYPIHELHLRGLHTGPSVSRVHQYQDQA